MKFTKMLAVPVLTLFFFGFAFIPQEEEAVITGTVEPAEAYPVIWVIDGNEAVAQQEAERNGEFSVQVPSGTFDIYVEPTVEGYEIGYVEDVSVSSGDDKDIGVIEIPQ